MESGKRADMHLQPDVGPFSGMLSSTSNSLVTWLYRLGAARCDGFNANTPLEAGLESV
jgi:hypothetical protein